MAFMDLAKSRYSVRKFSDKPIEKEKVGCYPGSRAHCSDGA